MTQLEDHLLIWLKNSAENPLIAPFHLPGAEGYWPVFLSGEAVRAFRSNTLTQLYGQQLVEGIVYGLNGYEDYDKPWKVPRFHKTMHAFLLEAKTNLGLDSLEQLFVDVADVLRSRNGYSVSAVALMSACESTKKSSFVQAQLICDLWGWALEEDDLTPLEIIVPVLDQIKLDSIEPDARDLVCYYGLCSLYLLGQRNEVKAFKQQYISGVVRHPVLLEKIAEMAKTTDGLTIHDLKVQ